MSILIHGTCVALGEAGVLLRGPSGSGKSDLALRLLDAGATLVADDQVALQDDGGGLVASAPAALAGLLEIRGIGLMRVAARSAPLRLVADLVSPDAVPRMPEPAQCLTTLGPSAVALPCLALAPFEASAVAKVKQALALALGQAMVVR